MDTYRIHVVTTKTTHNSLAFNLPLQLHQKDLSKLGLNIRLFFSLEKAMSECDVFFINSKYFRSGFTNENIFHNLQNLRKYAQVVLWFDTTDSTGATQFEVLPFVDGYYKNQILKNRELYLENFYASRIFTDFYHQKFDIVDDDIGFETVLPAKSDLPKIQVSWNSSLGDYGPHSAYYQRLRKLFSISQKYSVKFHSPNKIRPIPISCRIGRSHRRKTILYQRNQLVELLEKHFKTDTTPIPINQYHRELQHTRLGVSPFGWGEIAYRDFEIMLSGATLVKPNMSHLETWPPLYEENVTYIPFQWDMQNIVSIINEALLNDSLSLIAIEAQKRYQKYLLNNQSLFSKHIFQIIQKHL